MAILFVDGFDKYAASNDMNIRYSRSDGNATFLSTGSQYSSGAAQVDGTASGSFNLTFPNVAVGGTLHFAMWVYLSVLNPNNFFGTFPFVDMRDSAAGDSAGIFYQGNALTMEQYGPFSRGVVGQSGTFPISASAWHHLEFAFKIDDTTGVAKCWLDESSLINFSGDTKVNAGSGSGFNQFRFYDPTDTGGHVIIDDLVVWDESGSDFTVTQLGKHRIETLTPDGNGATNNFTPSAGSNFQNVDDPDVNDGDSTYNESTTVGHQDIYTVGSLSSPPTTVHAVCVGAVSKFITGAATMRGLARSNGVTGESANEVLTSSYAFYQAAFGKDPGTSAAWVPGDIDNLQVGVKYQA